MKIEGLSLGKSTPDRMVIAVTTDDALRERKDLTLRFARSGRDATGP